MAVDWSPDCRDVLDSARDISKTLGHHEIVTLSHVFFALLPHVHRIPIERVMELAAVEMPPWDDGSVYLSPGGQTPSLKLALQHAINAAQSCDRPVSVRDIWDGLPHGDAETCSHLVGLFELET